MSALFVCDICVIYIDSGLPVNYTNNSLQVNIMEAFMLNNIESMLGYFSQIRRSYAGKLDLKYEGNKLSPNEIAVLIMLSRNKNIDTASQIGVILGVSKGLVSRSIDALIGYGLVEKKKDELDKRITHLRISKEAELFIDEMRVQINSINEKVFQDIPKEEIEQMENTMLKILNKFKELEE